MWNHRIENEQLAFLREIEAFRLLNNSKLKAILDQFKPLHKLRGSFLYREGDPVDNIYLVRSGEFTVLKKVYFKKATDQSDATAIFRDPLKSKKKESKFNVKNLCSQFETQKLGCVQVM
jgi:hypothetical protein